MPIDQTKLGEVVAEQMEALEREYGEDAEIGDVCTIVEVLSPDGWTVRVRNSAGRPHIGIGLTRMAERVMLASATGGEASQEEG
jgi:hypothetical protein